MHVLLDDENELVVSGEIDSSGYAALPDTLQGTYILCIQTDDAEYIGEIEL